MPCKTRARKERRRREEGMASYHAALSGPCPGTHIMTETIKYPGRGEKGREKKRGGGEKAKTINKPL